MLLIQYLAHIPIDHFKLAVRRAKRQTGKTPGSGTVFQVTQKSLPVLRIGECSFRHGADLGQAKSDDRLIVQNDLLIHSVHIELAHLFNGLRTLFTHISGQQCK